MPTQLQERPLGDLDARSAASRTPYDDDGLATAYRLGLSSGQRVRTMDEACPYEGVLNPYRRAFFDGFVEAQAARKEVTA